MRGAGLITAALMLLPDLAFCHSLTVNLWPESDPDSAIFCTLSLSAGQLSAVEAKGLGLENPRALRWWASAADTSAFLGGMQALIDGRVPSENPLYAPRPAPPFLTVTWTANVNGQIVSGRYTATDLALPG